MQTVLLVIGILIVLLLAYAAVRPNTLRVERATRVKAMPEAIFPLINDLHAWRSWSPYENKDPVMKREYSGPTTGPGAAYAWDGDKNVGRGSMRITETSPPERVTIDLHFLKPMEGRNTVVFTMAPEGSATRVSWTMHGLMPFVSRLVGIFLDMDNMIGKDFAAGLANLKKVVET